MLKSDNLHPWTMYQSIVCVAVCFQWNAISKQKKELVHSATVALWVVIIMIMASWTCWRQQIRNEQQNNIRQYNAKGFLGSEMGWIYHIKLIILTFFLWFWSRCWSCQLIFSMMRKVVREYNLQVADQVDRSSFLLQICIHHLEEKKEHKL